MTEESGAGEASADAIPSRMPNWVAYGWLSLLEAVVAAGLVLFAIVLLEGGELLPIDLPEFLVGTVVFAAVFLGGVLFKIYMSSNRN